MPQPKLFKNITVGIVANEFFDPLIAGMGGFGWLAREVAHLFKLIPAQGVDPVFLMGRPGPQTQAKITGSHGVPLVFAQNDWPDYVRAVQDHDIDILLTIDYRPDYVFPLAALPDIPVIVWIQDPRPPEDVSKVNSLRIPDQKMSVVKGIDSIDCTGLNEVVKRSVASGRTLLF